MRVISHPFRLDSAGNVVTIDAGSPRQAAELAGHVVACQVGERPLAPAYGLPDPSGQELDAAVVEAAVQLCEPDLTVTSASVSPPDATGRVTVAVNVVWK